MSAVRYFNHSIDYETGQYGSIGIAPQHFGIDYFFCCDNNVFGRLRHNADVRPQDSWLRLHIPVTVRPMCVDQCDIGHHCPARQYRESSKRIFDQFQIMRILRYQIGTNRSARRQEGQISGAGAETRACVRAGDRARRQDAARGRASGDRHRDHRARS